MRELVKAGAESGTRTRTGLTPVDFESTASTDSAISARTRIVATPLPKVNGQRDVKYNHENLIKTRKIVEQV